MGNKKPSPPNHMAIQWHDYVQQEGEQSILTASLTAKASVVGRTGLMLLACGTGACAVFAAARRLGLCGPEVTVRLPGGVLTLEERERRIFLTGPARTVFEGEIGE